MECAWKNIDCLWNGEPALGLKAAHVADGLAISIASRQEWPILEDSDFNRAQATFASDFVNYSSIFAPWKRKICFK